ncbi:MAG: mechanosensitive ion channel [Ardenticatenaceae bacterium]|nr:mechanosensitive ion channel [Ardenticatenaceae bacterium]
MIALVLIQLTVWLFNRVQLTAGLIQISAAFFGIVLVYRISVALIFTWASERRARFYRSRILIPLFIVLPLIYFLDQVLDLRSILTINIVSILSLRITIGQIALAAVWIYVFFILGWVVEEGLRKVVMPRTPADSGVINSVSTISRYVIVVVGILVVFNALGVDLTSLALIGTGLSVGIGFGLQQIIANFISGIVLLFEQSLRPGDVIEVNNQMGTVEKLNIRSTIIRTNDNVEIIVPNETFLTSQLTTYTKTNPLVRVSIPVSVSYASDPKAVRDILTNTAVKHGLVRKDPAPFVFFEGFGESSIDFTLVIWMDEPARRRRVRSDLYYMVWDALDKYGIEIPFPQRDLNLRGGWEEFVQTMAQRSDREPADQADSEPQQDEAHE